MKREGADPLENTSIWGQSEMGAEEQEGRWQVTAASQRPGEREFQEGIDGQQDGVPERLRG